LQFSAGLNIVDASPATGGAVLSSNILIIDEGTTSTRAVVFDRDFRQLALAQEELALSFPADGHVEQDGEAIWTATLEACRKAVDAAGGVGALAGVAITNQRETTLVWERGTGKPVAPAIVWQDRRTAQSCAALKAKGHEKKVAAATGLLLDPYFSATKIAWILDSRPELRKRAARGELAFGTIDTWLIWKLTGGKSHVTDVTNASRTLLMDLKAGAWSKPMLRLFDIPGALLPEIRPSVGELGATDPALLGASLPILAAAGDQQAALMGQGCLDPGMAKITLGTGAFLVANTGARLPASRHRLLATKAYDISGGESAYALEGSIFNAGTVVKWLRDELALVSQASDTEAMAAELPDNGGVYFVPAFTGLGAPHWLADARGQITGLGRGTRAAHIVRAGLEACAYQTRDLLDAFRADGAAVETLRVDGGMAANDWLMQFMADICAIPVERPDYTEMTALGAAALAAMQLGWITPRGWAESNTPRRRFEPSMEAREREALLKGWKRAITALTAHD